MRPESLRDAPKLIFPAAVSVASVCVKPRVLVRPVLPLGNVTEPVSPACGAEDHCVIAPERGCPFFEKVRAAGFRPGVFRGTVRLSFVALTTCCPGRTGVLLRENVRA